LDLVVEQKKEKKNPLPSRYDPEISSADETSPPVKRRQSDQVIPIPRYQHHTDIDIVLHLKDVFFEDERQLIKKIEFNQDLIKLIVYHKEAFIPFFLRLNISIEVYVCFERSTIMINIILEPNIYFDEKPHFVTLTFQNDEEEFKDQFNKLTKKYRTFDDSKIIS
jgi:hypothetical protein